MDNNGWGEYKQRIFFQLDELTKKVDKLDTKVDRLREDVVVLKTKAWLFGIIGGTIVTILLQFFLTMLDK